MKNNGKTIAMVLGLALAAALPLAAHSQAAARGTYVGVGVGQAEAVNYNDRTCVPQMTANCNKKTSVYRFFGGWQFSRNWGVEFAYSDLGKTTSSTPGTFDESVKARVGELTAVGWWPVSDRAAVYGKFGGYYGTSSADTTNAGVNQRITRGRANYTFAGGVQLYITESVAVRGEGQHYVKVGTGVGDLDYTAYTLGVLFKF